MLHCKLIALVVLTGAYVAHGTWCTNKVVGFQTVNAFTNVAKNLTEPSTGSSTPIYLTDFETCELNFIAQVESTPANCDQGKIRCVKVMLGSESRKEKVAPYTLYGDDASKNFFEDKKPALGVQKLKACPYSNDACTQRRGSCKEMMVNITSVPVTPYVAVFDAAKGPSSQAAGNLTAGTLVQLCLPKSGQVNILAKVGCDYEELDFEIIDETEGEINDFTVEFESPYWMYGNSALKYDGKKTYNLYGRIGFQLNREYSLNIYPDGDDSKIIERRLKFNRNCTN